MVDDEVGGGERVHPRRVAAHRRDGLAHRGEVDDGRDAGEVLHQDARGVEGDLGVGLGLRVPRGEGEDVLLLHDAAVLVAEEVLEEDLQGVGERPHLRVLLRERLEAEDVERSRLRRRGSSSS